MTLSFGEPGAASGPVVAGFPTREYPVEIAGRRLRILGPAEPHAVHDDPRNRARQEEDGDRAYWAEPWAGAAMLANFVLEHAPAEAAAVLELGAGLGVAGIALTALGRRVVVTDYNDEALEFVRANATANGVELHEVRLLDWRSPPSERFTTIIGAEVLYRRESHAPILALLAACLAPGGTAYFSDLNRTAADGFADAARAGGFLCDVYAVDGRPIRPLGAIDGRVLHGRVFRVCRPQAR